MLKHVTFLGATALSLGLAASAWAQDAEAEVEATDAAPAQEPETPSYVDADASTVIVTVGETEITLGELIIAKTRLPQQYAQFPNSVLFEGLVDQLIQQQLLADALEGEPAVVEYALRNERRTLMANEMITGVVENSVSEDDIQAAYDARFAEVEELPEFNASHLLVETEEEAVAAKARIDEGAEFADVARDVSTGPTGPNGGNLGWFSTGAMVPEFENAITALEVGAVSDPFETQFGWHVATLNEKRAQSQPTLDEVRGQLMNELQEAAVTAKLDELAANTAVVKSEAGEINPDLLDNLDLLQQ
ncbi:peptidylprolyl isomerase [Loktanella agnita]|uniref:peptidylprolyl isomerase n=1 Tax=Loktanella agnita TaxID=287097 RepID=UPI003986B8F2